MKILWLSHIVPYPPKAGVLQRAYNMLNECAKYHEIDLLTFVQKGILKLIYGDSDSGLNDAKSSLAIICNRAEYVPIDSELSASGQYMLAMKSLFTKDPYTINWLKSRVYLDIMKNWLKQSDYDLVYFDTISLAIYHDQVTDIPTIMDHHNIESHLLLRRASQESNFIKKLYYYQEGRRLERYERKICERFTLNITCSEMDSERLKRINANIDTMSIPNGVSISSDLLSADLTLDKSIVFVGTLNWEPNRKAVLYLADEIWPLLKEQYPDVVCDIVGAHPPKELSDLSEKDKNFRVHGFVPELTPYLRPGSIFVCPIKDGGGTKLKVLDALAMKAAVVADPIACEGINVTDRIDVLLSSTPQDYVDNILELFSNDKLRVDIGEHARQLIKNKYSYESIGKNFSDVCEKVAINSD